MTPRVYARALRARFWLVSRGSSSAVDRFRACGSRLYARRVPFCDAVPGYDCGPVQEMWAFTDHLVEDMADFCPHVLVVDDTATIRTLIRAEFAGMNVTLEEAVDGLDALQKIKRRRPDLITLDIEMPKLDGYGVCRMLSGSTDTMGIPVLMISSQSGDQYRLRALEGGAIEYFVKPFRAGDLRKMAQGLLIRIQENRSRSIYSLDNSEEVRFYLDDTLTKHGYIHRGFSDPVALAAELATNPCDLLVLDFQLPEHGTYRVLDAIKLLPPDTLRVLALTNGHARRDLVNALNSGAADFVRKPFFVEELLARIERQLRLQTEARELRELATIDPLTRSVNRGELMRLASVEVDFARRDGCDLGIVIVDIDHFKKINDNHGHPFGDHVLRLVAQALKGQIRSTDIVGRYGGEEFVVLLPRVTRTSLQFVAERLRRGVSQLEVVAESQKIPVTVSVGGQIWKHDELTTMEFSTLIEGADRCLYRAKESGRNRVVTDLGEHQSGVVPPNTKRSLAS
jgi:two-component system, cell cycle response regulator